ncbi:MAG: hypothetical protein AAB903_02370 [Patescibacteria group bacterium]|mgnify:FL=1
MRQCQLCGKGSIIRGKRKLLRGHYNPIPGQRKYPNLQWARVKDVRMKICMSCLRKLNQVKTKVAATRKKTKKEA